MSLGHVSGGCPVCACRAGSQPHGIVAALLRDDLDAAIELGLLTCAPCPGCTPQCQASIAAARDARLTALAARERYRARQARLAERVQERARRRAQAAAASPSALPPAAAAALQRALAKARRP
jgi:hypothetical protein